MNARARFKFWIEWRTLLQLAPCMYLLFLHIASNPQIHTSSGMSWKRQTPQAGWKELGSPVRHTDGRRGDEKDNWECSVWAKKKKIASSGTNRKSLSRKVGPRIVSEANRKAESHPVFKTRPLEISQRISTKRAKRHIWEHLISGKIGDFHHLISKKEISDHQKSRSKRISLRLFRAAGGMTAPSPWKSVTSHSVAPKSKLISDLVSWREWSGFLARIWRDIFSPLFSASHKAYISPFSFLHIADIKMELKNVTEIVCSKEKNRIGESQTHSHPTICFLKIVTFLFPLHVSAEMAICFRTTPKV